MSLCCCSAAAGRGVLLSSLLLGRRHLPRHPLLNLRTTTTVASSSAAAAITSLSPPQQRQVTIYVDTLLEWNQVRPEPLSSAGTTSDIPRHGTLPTARRCPARASLTHSNLFRG